MRPRSATTWSLAVLIVAIASAPAFAWLYDGGQPQHAGPVIKDPGTPVWVTQPFKLSTDAEATSFGVAMGRILGTDSMGFKVFLSDTLIDAPDNAIAGWEMRPTRAVLEYYYYEPESPVRLEAGRMYYLTFAPNSSSFWGSISYSQATGYYGRGTNDHGVTWYGMSYPFCVRIDGYYVPEPGTGIALLAGVIVVMLSRRRCCVSPEEADRG